jgi:hypothetical protein
VEQDDEWRIDGAAVFQHEIGTAALVYQVELDREWRTRQGLINGWLGAHRISVRITRGPNSAWELNGRTVPSLRECVDLDLGFTPATNLAQLRRIALDVGQGADVPVAWLDVPFDSLEMLQQHYEKRTAETYWYEAPRFDYAATLRVSETGFVQLYPGLWEAEHEAA